MKRLRWTERVRESVRCREFKDYNKQGYQNCSGQRDTLHPLKMHMSYHDTFSQYFR